jgi:hypothetical protein
MDLSTVPQISTDAFMRRQSMYDFGNPSTIDDHLAAAMENNDGATFLAVLGNAYGR